MLEIELGRRRSLPSPEAAGANGDDSSRRAQSLRTLRLTTRRLPRGEQLDSPQDPRSRGVRRSLESVRDLAMLLQQNADRVLWAAVVFIGLGLAVMWGLG